jgi:hypothetical protein
MCFAGRLARTLVVYAYSTISRDCFSYKLYHQLVCYSPLLLLCLWRQRLCMQFVITWQAIHEVNWIDAVTDPCNSQYTLFEKNSQYIYSKYSYWTVLIEVFNNIAWPLQRYSGTDFHKPVYKKKTRKCVNINCALRGKQTLKEGRQKQIATMLTIWDNNICILFLKIPQTKYEKTLIIYHVFTLICCTTKNYLHLFYFFIWGEAGWAD